MAQAEIKTIATLDPKPFQSGIAGMKQQTQGFGAALAGMKGMIVGAFSIGALMSFGRKLLEVGDNLQTAANTFGISLTSMIAFKSVMAESGIGADRFMRIFGKLNSALSEAKKGVTTYVDAFKMMGISQKDFAGLGMDKVLELMAKKYGEANDKAEFLAGTSKAFGERIGPNLIEVFQRINREGLAKFTEEARKAAEGMAALAKISDFTEKAGNRFIVWGAMAVGTLQDIADLADAASLAMQGVVPAGKIFELARSIREKREKRAGVGGAEEAAGLTPTAEETKWYTLMEEKLLGRKNLTEKIAWYEQEITALQKARAENPTDLAIATQILEVEKKRDAVMRARTKQDYAESEKLDAMYEAQDKLAVEYAQKRKDIMAGKGIEVPTMARVDPLQAIGGLIGGVAGRGDQAARIAERQAKSMEAIETLIRETNTKMDELNRKMDGIISE